MQFLFFLLLFAAGLIVLGLVIAFVLVPVLRGIGWLIVAVCRGIGWLIMHIVEFVGGMVSDVLRLVGSLLVMLVLLPFAPFNVIIGRWSAAGHYAESLKRECSVAGMCLYRLLLRRPLKLVMLHGILEGVEQRLPEAMAAAPTSDKPGRRTGQFDGYTIVGSLPGGGSGAKLYVAEPTDDKRARVAGMPGRVVIKSFTLSEGSSLPQIVRESRALESAKQLGHVLDHGMSEHRFFYVMPYHPGEHLGVITRQLHARSDGKGLADPALRTVMSYVDDLLQTLSHYHRGGLWHKDVKPENVIVHDDQAHLVDLGLVTPLRSAMTLTTHGTEYFRDPEMVRQALRGVKVHQVDGAKFDVYAVGAVLYFMVENTFPAHGGLSSFSKRSPEGLRWIVRRAMADYNKRYATADAMLADLRAIRNAGDLFAVRPADLPSMRGEEALVADAEPRRESVESVAFAGSPLPSRLEPEPVSIAASAMAAAGRPKLRVTNWWTGAYDVEALEGGGAQQPFREQASALRWESRELKRRVREGSIGARRAAKEQIRAARTRARELRQRASTRRHRAVAERQPSAALGLAVLAFLLLFSAAFVFMLTASRRSSTTVLVHNGPPASTAVAAAAASVEVAAADKLMLLVDAPNRQDPPVMRRVKQILAAHRDEGVDVLLPKSDIEHDRYVALVRDWRESGASGPVGSALEEMLDALDVEGIVYVSPVLASHGALELQETLIDPSAIDQAIASASAAPAGPAERTLLLINDHPAKADPRVQQAVDGIVADLQRHRCDVVIDDQAEVEVRPLLPARPSHDASTSLPARFHVVLAELDYDGVIWVSAGPGEGAPHERIVIEQLDATRPELAPAG